MTTDPLAPYRWLQGPDESGSTSLGEIYCVSFFRGLGPAEVLRRFDPDGQPGSETTLGELDDQVLEFVEETDGGDGGGYVGVIAAGAWSVAVEPGGWHAVLLESAAKLSHGCEVVAVSRHDYAEDHFTYAADGEVITAFNPSWPFDRHGSDTGRLDDLMRGAGMSLEKPEDDAAWETAADDRHANGLARAFALAAAITGVPFTPDLLDGPFLVGPIAESHA
jgi:hypothetical protein